MTRFVTLLVSRGAPVSLYSRLHPAACAERLGAVRAGRGPAFFAPTRDFGPRIRGAADRFDVWFPGVGQSSYGYLRARLAPDTTGQGTWIVGETRMLALWRIAFVALAAAGAAVAVVAVAGVLRGDGRPGLLVGAVALAAFAALWYRGAMSADRRLRAWAGSVLEAVPVELTGPQPVAHR